MNYLILVLLFVSAVTSSFDVIGAFDFGGGNLRICLIPLLLLIPLLALSAGKGGFTVIATSKWLLAWLAMNCIFVVNSASMFRAASYLVWLSILIVFATLLAITCGRYSFFLSVFRVIYLAYLVNAIFGLIQFIAFRFGIDLLVQQEWGAGFARISGFTYEPSYFATYLSAPWGMGLILLAFGGRIFSTKIDIINFAIFSMAMILSSSRIGYMAMMAGVIALLAIWYGVVWRKGRKSARIKMVVAGFVAFSIIGFAVLLERGDLTMLLGGTGLGNTAAGSYDTRMDGITRGWDLFKSDPLVGYSVGGVAAEMARQLGYSTVDYDTLRTSQGVNVSIEILLATGLIGGIIFLVFIYKAAGIEMLWRWIKERRKMISDREVLVFSACFGVALEFFALQFNQNIIRNYLWIQVALALGGLSFLKKEQLLARSQSGREGRKVKRRWVRV